MEGPVTDGGAALPCRVALRQTFRQNGEIETARFLGRGRLTVANGEVLLACFFRYGDELPPQTLRFPLRDRAAVTVESPSGSLCFAGGGAADAAPVPLRLSTPAGVLEFLFSPISAENTVDPATGRGEVTLRYRLTGAGGLFREAELRYTLL